MATTSTTDSHPGHFARFTSAAAGHLGRPGMFLLAAALIVVWAVSGPFLHFSGTWQLIINTLVTFLMVFIIQNTQNRDSAAVHLKLDVIMRELGVQDPGLYDAEHRSEEELEAEDAFINPTSPGSDHLLASAPGRA